MRAFVQRVRGLTQIHSELGIHRQDAQFTGAGLVVLLGWMKDDIGCEKTREDWLISRVRGLRILPDVDGKMNLSLEGYLAGEPGGILWVPQFTLAASLDSGFRPSFGAAMAPDAARDRFIQLQTRLLNEGAPFQQIFGVFGADMELSFTNWGPVSIPIESKSA